ncbi:sulfurtransferase [Georgenia sp. Z1491]|uniref:sulfurtransferase n=1 Tax=Georgenia sp. Z1491 TaxID=3416707 RepID=UPI003CF69DB7
MSEQNTPTERPEPTDDAGSTGSPPAPEEATSPPAGGRKTWQTVVAVVAVAALAGTAGLLIGRGGTAEADADTPGSGAGQAGAVDGDTVVADTVSQSFAEGEHRGLDSVHQGGDEDIENVLVSTDWLAEQIGSGLEENNIVLVDVSEQLASSELTPYVDGHIPGAQFLDWATSFTQDNTREFIDADQFTEVSQGLGLDEDSTLVLYGDNNNWFAAYAAWVFNLYGFEDVRLLDGGLHKWEQVDGRELVQEVPQPEPGTWVAQPQNFDIRAFQPEVLDAVDTGSHTLIDIRSTEEYNGEVGVDPAIFGGESTVIWGHIPGAINVPWGSIVNEDGTYRSAEEIRAVYEEAGVDLDGPIITYCRIGERSSHTWFALSQILGLDVQNYDGSWTEWGNTVGVPVTNETGDRGGVWGTSR